MKLKSKKGDVDMESVIKGVFVALIFGILLWVGIYILKHFQIIG